MKGYDLMGLISKEVEINICGGNYKHYEELGYHIPRSKNKWGRMGILQGTKIIVKVEDLQKGSSTMVECMCDNCGKTYKMQYNTYNKILNVDNTIYCQKCAMKLYGIDHIYKSALKHGKTLTQWFIDNDLDINYYWDWNKNTIDPSSITHSSTREVWFKCRNADYHGSYKIKCLRFTKGNRCPYCASKKIHPKDSLGQHIVDNYGVEFLNKIWHSENEKSPFEYAQGNNEKIWWKCPIGKHEDFKRSPISSIIHGFRCPNCTYERTESMLEEKVRLYLESLGYEVLREYECTIKPRNPKTRCILPFDNEIILECEKHLIIEVHGQQHYKEGLYRSTNKSLHKSLEPKLHYQQLKDRYKKIYAIQNGYYYLEIPYWAIVNSNAYKTLIDDKIKEIVNKNY